MDYLIHTANGKTLCHSAKGSTWENHKYISKYTKNGKTYYVYPDSSKQSKSGVKYMSGPGGGLRAQTDENGYISGSVTAARNSKPKTQTLRQ